MSVCVSTATARDLRALVALRAEVAEAMKGLHGPGPWSELPSAARVRRQLRATTVLVAREGERLLGTVRLLPANQALFDFSFFTPAACALYVIGLAVSPACRGRGVARALMESAKAAARKWPADALWLDTYDGAVGAAGFYEKCGFRRVGLTTRDGAGLVFYEWRVNPP